LSQLHAEKRAQYEPDFNERHYLLAIEHFKELAQQGEIKLKEKDGNKRRRTHQQPRHNPGQLSGLRRNAQSASDYSPASAA
jgi:hypothetical protein